MAINNPLDQLAILIHHLVDPEGTGQKLRDGAKEYVAALGTFQQAKEEAAGIAQRVAEVGKREDAATARETACDMAEANHQAAVIALVANVRDLIETKAAALDEREGKIVAREAAIEEAEAKLAPLRDLAKKLSA